MSSENVPTRISRCLEEGAEEFFLKPLKKESEKPVAIEEIVVSKPEIEEESSVIEILPLHQEVESEQLEPMLSSNKRKAMEEVISTDQPRPKYNDITTSV
ncbi:unnamed protein product [Arabidopsis thaliana]|uniref:Response regulatory domain-containing protein n=1 Tax=Arabidopsis thaliana TaxID=3702 RepID=A0A5S9WXK0_ARATH|nr:unnamed protein product [Arabidopsis thaliana]